MRRLGVGRTRCRIREELCGRYGRAKVFVKDESRNPSGTVKDRRCAALLEAHASKDKVLFVHITSGNSGYSLGKLAEAWEDETGQERKVFNVVPKRLPLRLKRELQKCSTVHSMNLGKRMIDEDELIDLAREKTGFDGPDENIVIVESQGLKGGYSEIIREIHADGIRPTHIFVPVGGGELAIDLVDEAERTWGLCEGPESDEEGIWGKEALFMGRKGLEEKFWAVPEIVGVTVKQNPLSDSRIRFLKRPKQNIADKLVTAYTKFMDTVTRLVREGRLELMTANEMAIAREYNYLSSIGVNAEPSAAAAFAGAARYGLKEGDTAVIVNTGSGIYDSDAIKRMRRRKMLGVARLAAAAIAASALLAVVATFDFIVKRNKLVMESADRIVELQTKIRPNDPILHRLNSLREDVMDSADENGNGELDAAELREMCNDIPRRNCHEDAGSGELEYEDLTEAEIGYYLRQQREKAYQYASWYVDLSYADWRNPRSRRWRFGSDTTVRELQRDAEARLLRRLNAEGVCE